MKLADFVQAAILGAICTAFFLLCGCDELKESSTDTRWPAGTNLLTDAEGNPINIGPTNEAPLRTSGSNR